MEDMEDDCFGLNDDYNHNYCENSASGQVHYLRNELSDVPQPLSISPGKGTRDEAARENHAKVCSSSSSGLKFMDSDSNSVSSDTIETDSPSSASIAGKLTLNSASKFLVCTSVFVNSTLSYWNLIENFNIALTQYTDALQCIVPVFIYMNKFYIETKLNRDLREDLMKLFTDHVAEKHINTLIPLLLEAHAMPFQVRPSTMASVVKGLYTLWPDWAHLAPALFSGFIPQINPPTVESQLSDYAARDQKLQLELSLNGFH
ncbi:unnamed protein product, partial [Coregonus sp. 'balchen']